MLGNFDIPQLANLHPNIMFQRDGVPPPWRPFVRDCHVKNFPNLRIGRGRHIHYSMGLFCLGFF